jgi:4-hydroxy-2-oxoglutarate aldolase
MNDIKTKLSGVFAPIATPFREEDVFLEGLSSNIEKLNRSGLKGYFVLGTNGEYKSLSTEERAEVLKTVVACRSPDKIIMAGTGAESTKETIELTLMAAGLGVDMVSLLMPHFFAKKIDDEVLADYIRDVADRSPVPVLLYNNPSVAAGVTIGPELIRKVASHPNLVGIKDSSKQTFKGNLQAAGENLCVLAGSANYFLELLSAGGVGGVLSLANVFPDACAQLYRAFAEGRMEEAERLNLALVDLNAQVSGTYGVAGVKAAMDLVGFSGGAPRKPIKALTAEQKQQLAEVLKERGYLKREKSREQRRR